MDKLSVCHNPWHPTHAVSEPPQQPEKATEEGCDLEIVGQRVDSLLMSALRGGSGIIFVVMEQFCILIVVMIICDKNLLGACAHEHTDCVLRSLSTLKEASGFMKLLQSTC